MEVQFMEQEWGFKQGIIALFYTYTIQKSESSRFQRAQKPPWIQKVPDCGSMFLMERTHGTQIELVCFIIHPLRSLYTIVEDLSMN